MLDDPFAGSGLRPVEPGDRSQINSYLSQLAEPLSDYTFSQIFTWRNSLRLLWRDIDGHLCVFANGSGDLTMLLPPIGSTRSEQALRNAFELMNDYNAQHGVDPREHSRVEYVSEELKTRFDSGSVVVSPMGHDYVYSTAAMIELGGGDLKSKRQDRNRFTRDHRLVVESYSVAAHREECCELLKRWNSHRDNHDEPTHTLAAVKRQKELLAVELTLEHADDLGLTGIIVRAAPLAADASDPLPIVAFTFGEPLGGDQCSIVIEKTDLQLRGLAQFIFSEFCRRDWSHRPRVNAGDDWGLPSLAWTKMSYRPCALLNKFNLAQVAAIQTTGTTFETSSHVRPARKDDLETVMSLENSCFEKYQLSLRQLRYLQARTESTTSFFVAVDETNAIVGEAIGLLRQTRRGIVGRVYSLAVNASNRGQHLGRRLLEALIDDLANRGAVSVHLEVDLRSTAAIALYRSMGFRQAATLTDYYGEGHDGIRMNREIQTVRKLRADAA